MTGVFKVIIILNVPLNRLIFEFDENISENKNELNLKKK